MASHNDRVHDKYKEADNTDNNDNKEQPTDD